MQAGKDIIAETPVVEETVKAEIKMDENGQTKLFQPMTRSSFTEFKDFFNNVIENKNSTQKEQYNYLTKDGLNLRIVHDTILHDVKDKHKLQANDWEDFLNNIDNVEIAENSKHKARYNGKPVLLKVKSGNKSYGAVIEIFKKNNPIITTAFYDDEVGIDNWIKNEAVSSGTKTTFSNISLNNIISNVSPNFKTKVIKNGENNTKLYQVKDQTETEAFKKWFGDSKVVDENGKPLVVYHGSPNKFEAFDKTKVGTRDSGDFGKGFYFTKYYDRAGDYSGDTNYNPYTEKGNYKNIYSVYLNIKNPYFASETQVGQLDTEALKARGYDGVAIYFENKYTEKY